MEISRTIAIQLFSQTQLSLINGTVRCYMFPCLRNCHQVIHTKHLNTSVPHVFPNALVISYLHYFACKTPVHICDM